MINYCNLLTIIDFIYFISIIYTINKIVVIILKSPFESYLKPIILNFKYKMNSLLVRKKLMLHEECKINQNNKIMKGVIRFSPPELYLHLYPVMVLKTKYY